MATLPDIAPNQLSFDLGKPNISEVSTPAGPVIFRHSQRINNHELTVRYTGLSQAQIEQFRQHYIDSSGTGGYFDVAASFWGGLTVVDPSSTYRYTTRPEEEHMGLYYNLSINLKVIDGIQVLFILAGGTSDDRPATPFTSFVFNGTAPFVLASGNSTTAATLVLQGGSAR